MNFFYNWCPCYWLYAIKYTYSVLIKMQMKPPNFSGIFFIFQWKCEWIHKNHDNIMLNDTTKSHIKWSFWMFEVSFKSRPFRLIYVFLFILFPWLVFVLFFVLLRFLFRFTFVIIYFHLVVSIRMFMYTSIIYNWIVVY